MQLVLIRHAHSEANAKALLSGRTAGVHLSPKGQSQSQELISRLGRLKVATLRISPLERCFETINPWWDSLGKEQNPSVELIRDENLNEVDYGDWSGKKLAVLSKKKLWSTVQNSPSAMYFPAGEGLAQMQERAMRAVHEAATTPKKGVVIFVTHGDVIKSIVASALGMHLDSFQRLVIDPASVNVLDYSGIKPRVLLLNDSRAILEEFLNAPYRKKNLLGGGGGGK
jgi:probable phosphoglycerate mutase